MCSSSQISCSFQFYVLAYLISAIILLIMAFCGFVTTDGKKWKSLVFSLVGFALTPLMIDYAAFIGVTVLGLGIGYGIVVAGMTLRKVAGGYIHSWLKQLAESVE